MTPVRILLSHAIDYAGMFPPAALPMTQAVTNYRRYMESENAWALGRFVVPAARVSESGFPADVVSAVSGDEETAGAIRYCERPPDSIADGRAKIRTGGVTPDRFPSAAQVAAFLAECARRKLAFKATAGLHHALRGEYRLTYEPGSASATMHGFLNVFIAAAFAWQGVAEQDLPAILQERRASAFQVDEDGIGYGGRRIGNSQLSDARANFVIGFGSCSFEEPLRDLEEMGLL